MRFLLFLTVISLLWGCDSRERLLSAHDPVRNPELMLLELTDEHRFVSIDEVADGIINQDPSLLLVDVRSHQEYDAFSLPGAVNIPLEKLNTDEYRLQLDCERYAIIFFSNDELIAEQAWMLSRMQGCENIRLMQGGLNAWAELILQHPEPPATASAGEWERYRFRKAACQYFIGQATALDPEPYVEPVRVQPVKKIEVKPKKKQVVEEEGC